MHSYTSHALHFVIEFVCILSVFAEFKSNSAAHGVLKKSMGIFQLTGNARPTLREVNGGRLCVNGYGKGPPGYYFSGKISLDQCANIAHEQPAPLGFRWGRPGFDYSVYSSYATANPSGGNETEAVDLGKLFPDAGDFVCTIYVGLDSRGQPFTFAKTNSSRDFDPKIKDGPADSVCFQRWTMTEFFKPFVSELWFCFMPKSGMDACRQQADEFYTQGKFFVVVFVLFLAVLGWIMADMPEFELPLVWFSRLLLSLELGMLAIAFLLERWYDTESPVFFMIAYFMNVIGAAILFIPYWVMEKLSEDSPFNTAYLLLLAFSPCFLMEFMSYWSHFILLVGHQPLLIGVIAFSTTAVAIQYLNRLKEHFGEVEEDHIGRSVSMNSIDKASYVSVPTSEPAECCAAGSRWKVRVSEKFPRVCP